MTSWLVTCFCHDVESIEDAKNVLEALLHSDQPLLRLYAIATKLLELVSLVHNVDSPDNLTNLKRTPRNHPELLKRAVLESSGATNLYFLLKSPQLGQLRAVYRHASYQLQLYFHLCYNKRWTNWKWTIMSTVTVGALASYYVYQHKK